MKTFLKSDRTLYDSSALIEVSEPASTAWQEGMGVEDFVCGSTPAIRLLGRLELNTVHATAGCQ